MGRLVKTAEAHAFAGHASKSILRPAFKNARKRLWFSVMALALALYGWDRVQAAPPEPMPLPLAQPDDPTLDLAQTRPFVAGSVAQLPGEW